MARTKMRKSGTTGSEIANSRRSHVQANMKSNGTDSTHTPQSLYATAVEFAEQGQYEIALKTAKQLLKRVQNGKSREALPALNLLGEISIELGAVASAREYFLNAVKLDPRGEVSETDGGGAEKFLWLAQLSEEGGKESVEWFEKGIQALQYEITAIEQGRLVGLDEETLSTMLAIKKHKLATAQCGIIEIYMTDLSWDDDAESRCENLITQAMAAEDETSPEVLQTLASIRLSQERKEDAQSALRRSMESWIDLEPEDPSVPDFAIRISLSRLLMEAEMEDEAMRVLDRLVQEDDQSVETWYLGGWCQYLISQRSMTRDTTNSTHDGNVGQPDGSMMIDDNDDTNTETKQAVMKGSRKWLRMALRLSEQLTYEDKRLMDHARELVDDLNTALGLDVGDADEGEEGEWEDWAGLGENEEDDGLEEEDGGDCREHSHDRDETMHD